MSDEAKPSELAMAAARKVSYWEVEGVPPSTEDIAAALDAFAALKTEDLRSALAQCVRQWEAEPGTGGCTMDDVINDAREALGIPTKPRRP